MNGSNKYLIYSGWFCIAVLTLLKIYSASTLDLFEDEALYWMWSLNPDPSYSFITLISIKLSTLLFSYDHEAIIRFPALLSNLLIIILLIKISKELGFGKTQTIYLILIFLSVPFVTIYTTFISPDTFLLVFTVASYYSWLKLIGNNTTKNYFYLGLSLGLAVLSKYQGVIIFAVLVLISILFCSKKSYSIGNLLILIGIFLLTISPLIIWNILHEPVWLNYYLHTDADKISGNFLSMFHTLFLSQTSILMPFIFLFLMWITYLLFTNSFKDIRFSSLKLAYFCTGTFLFLCSISGKIKGNWFFVIYIPLLFLAPYFYKNKISKILFTLAFLFNVFILISINMSAGYLSLMSKNPIINYLNSGYTDYWPGSLSEKNVDRNWLERINKMKFWKANVEKIEEEINKSGLSYDYIVSDDFNLAPLLRYYFENKPEVFIINDLRFRYINSIEFRPDLKNKNFIIVSYNDDWKKNISGKFAFLKENSSIDLFINDTKFNSVTILRADKYKMESNF